MFCKKLDILSPPITLYNKGILYHSSTPSIVLSIISFIVITIFSIGELVIFIFNADRPTLTLYNKYVQEAGSIGLNSSSFFHFISIQKNIDNPEEQEIDFESFRLIGFETYLDEYINDKNLSNFNHWLYGQCNNDTDTIGISDLITQKYFTKSACIKKYFDSKEQKYYDLNESKFKVPKIEHGTINFTKSFYSIIIEDCEDDSLKILFTDNRKCKKENNTYIKNIIKNGFINFHFIDHEVQNEDYFRPIRKFFHIICHKLSKDNYFINNLYFSPIALISNYHSFFNNKLTSNYSYTLDRNSESIKDKNNEKNIYISYYLWLNKRINLYYREHLTLIDAISNIGGVSNVIISIFFFINKIFNSYSIYSDSKELFNFSIKQTKNNNQKIKLNHLLYKNNFESSKTLPPSLKEKKEISNIDKEKCTNINKKANENNESLSGNGNIFNDACIKENSCRNSVSSIVNGKEKDYRNSISYIVNGKENNYRNSISYIIIGNENKRFNKRKLEKKGKLTFCEYCKYKISFGKINGELQLYEYFLIKVVSIENLLNNYLKVNDLIKVKNKINN